MEALSKTWALKVIWLLWLRLFTVFDLLTFFSKLWNSVIIPDQIPPAAINPKCPQQHV